MSIARTVEERLRPAERALSVIWAAFTLTMVIVAGILWAVVDAPVSTSNGGIGVLRTVLHVGAVGLAIASLVLRSLLLSDRRLRRILSRGAYVGDMANRPGWLDLSRWATTAYVIGWSANELILMLGVVLVVLSGRGSDIGAFAFMAVVLQLLTFPRLEPLIRRARAIAAVDA